MPYHHRRALINEVRRLFIMNINHNLQRFFFIGVLLLSSFQATAHALKETSAYITLREGQIEIRLSTDIKRWQTLLQENEAWLMGDIDQVMPADLNPKQNQAFLIKLLQEKTVISVNNKQVVFNAVSIPDSAVQHGRYAEIILSGKHTNTTVDQLSIQFPKSLGAIHASIVQPKYKMMTAGSSAQISFAPLVDKKIASHHH